MATALRAFQTVKPAHLVLARTIDLVPRPKTATPDLARDGCIFILYLSPAKPR
jgi:hypothetical protein